MNEAELLFTQALGCDRAALYFNKRGSLNSRQAAFVSTALKRRIKGEPIQYILGKTEFMGLEFKVNKDVLIPRPETEILVETAIKIVRKFVALAKGGQTTALWPASSQVRKLRILDIGTGSGCIAISLAKFLPEASITATDISDKALETAKENAKFNNVEDKIVFLRSDLFESLAICDMRYAICVCNPPYIAAGEIDNLQPEIKYEPRIALDGGKDGLGFYRRIIKEAPDYLRDNGILIMEIGFGQAQAIGDIFRESGNFKILEIVKDYNNIDRVITAKRGRKE
ncbi:MAG: peptide chain release factor N(5)-glutamine methyltransferase [Candidatus Omnitrophica bacterium CG08_land_8_20_14_0_20_41_16]|uniref:Release factor glutamine methyltransferase n=1 Tax=Candidatus Sherwoodlollariibacterium unditelluris TaxID=1974757 RepID=A0A2G9YL42_9BACT|nr:MAG: protein-(glutamine-N5) methyltransferase, release factor-specific [Candidatus Omnitrophica bacterium CG23_combo_of_CG06-09_8_20_14_all_41_10]PIS34020.1 MAG: peptide chain release factor N(5)-glutamine methyltransferase [Candidatus Omnitrophica bacterium CG08_land_8_20_14_0_20_41_16]